MKIYLYLGMKKNIVNTVIIIAIISISIWVIMKFRADNINANKEEALETEIRSKTKDSLINLDTLNYLNLKAKYDAIELDLDTLNFTYEIEELIKSYKNPIIIEGKIIDIENKKTIELYSNSELELNDGYKLKTIIAFKRISRKIIIDLILDIDEPLFMKFIPMFKERKNYSLKNSKNVYFLFSTKSINKELNDEEKCIFKIEGKLIDFYYPHNPGLYYSHKTIEDALIDLAK
jgi:hypothetical protein